MRERVKSEYQERGAEVPTELLRKGVWTRDLVAEAGVGRARGEGSLERRLSGSGPGICPSRTQPAVDRGRAEEQR